MTLSTKPVVRAPKLDQVFAADLSSFTEMDRIAHVAKVRDALDAISNAKRPTADQLAKKIKLLRLWCVLVKLRVESVRVNEPPPEHQASVKRTIVKTKGKKNGGREEARNKQIVKMQDDDLVPPKIDSGRVELRLLEAGMVRGVMLPAGIVIEVEAHDAGELLDSKMAERTNVGGAE